MSYADPVIYLSHETKGDKIELPALLSGALAGLSLRSKWVNKFDKEIYLLLDEGRYLIKYLRSGQQSPPSYKQMKANALNPSAGRKAKIC